MNPIVFPEKHCQLYFSRSITTPRYRFQLRFYLDTYISWSNPRNFSRALNRLLSWRSHLTRIRTHHPHHHCLAWRRKSPPPLHRSTRLLRRRKATENQAWRRTTPCTIFFHTSSHQPRVVSSPLVPDEYHQEDRRADQRAQQCREEQP